MTLTSPVDRGIVLFAHGSRDPLWRVPIEAVAAQISTRHPNALVRCAYLEISTPSLHEAATDLIGLGARSLRVLPLFLGVGKHAREDTPLLIEELRAAHPNVTIELLPAVGEYERVTMLMADIAMA